MAGRPVLTGGAAATVAVGADVPMSSPALLVPRTSTRTVPPTSSEVSV